MSDLWTDIDPDSDYSVDGSSDEGSKDQDNLDYQEQEVVSDPRINTRILRRGDQRALR